MQKNKLFLVFLCLVILVSLIFIGISFPNEKEVFKEEDNDIFKEDYSNHLFYEYYDKAEQIMKSMTIEQKVSQLFLVKSSKKLKIDDSSYLGGYVFFSEDFQNETKESFKNKVLELQSNAKIKYTLAVDEEGGTVTRISSKKAFRNERFLSPRDLYTKGGLDLVLQAEEEKIELLKYLNLNLNLAPVADISTSKTDYMYARSIGLDEKETSNYIASVTEKYLANNFSSCLKHFPGYGNNVDTHKGTSIDNRTIEDLKNKDLLPFIAGIKAKTPYILISHNNLPNIDKIYPASLSKNVINILKNDLNYTGLIITDDLSMDALAEYENIAILAIEAGNDVLITNEYNKHYEELLNAIKENKIDEERINYSVRKIIAWKIAYNII